MLTLAFIYPYALTYSHSHTNALIYSLLHSLTVHTHIPTHSHTNALTYSLIHILHSPTHLLTYALTRILTQALTSPFYLFFTVQNLFTHTFTHQSL